MELGCLRSQMVSALATVAISAKRFQLTPAATLASRLRKRSVKCSGLSFGH